MDIRIPPEGLLLSMGSDGQLDGSLTIHLRFDVCATWIELALRHLDDARAKRKSREAAWAGTDEAAKGSTLEREFEASMQAMTAAATAIEAFYSVLRTEVALPPSIVQAWRNNRTARYSQVTEVVRRALGIKQGIASVRGYLKEIYRFRDLAVHPPGKIQVPIHHPELDVGVEWRFAYFRAGNAELIVNAATWLIWELVHHGKPKTKGIAAYVAPLKERLREAFPDGHPFEQNSNG